MKSSFRLILAAFAATAALTACTKEITPPNFENDKVNPAAEGSRVIAVSFAPQTKTSFTETPDGIQPEFDDKDSILLVSWPANAAPITETRKVSVDENTGVATISTNLTGDLTAIYPAKYAQQQKKAYGVIVPPIQTGKFKDANICGAQIKEGEGSAVFMNLSTLFIIEPPATSVKSLTIKSLYTIENGGQRTGRRAQINISNNAGDNRYVIHVPNGPCNDGKYYVAVATTGKDDVNLSDLSFEVEYETSGTGAVKGLPKSVIEQQAKENKLTYDKYNTIVSGTSYTINKNNNWHEYVTVGNRKWATVNIGAESPTDVGEYFMWGEIVGHKADLSGNPSENMYVNAFLSDFAGFNHQDSRYNNNLWSEEKGFSGCNTPYVLSATPEENEYVGVLWKCTFSKYTDENGGVLELCDDAANVKWGGAWRMPTVADVEVLENITEQKWETNYLSSGIEGSVFSENNQTLFFPASGSGWGSDLKYLNYSFAWSSSYFMYENESIPYGIQITEGSNWKEFNPYRANRNLGLPIRAIIDEPDAVTPAPEVVPEGALSGKFTINADGDQVYFSKGNLYYENTVPKFEANQYDYRIYCGKDDDQAVIGGVLTTTPSGNVGSFFWCDNAAAACAETYEDETPATKFFAEKLIVDGTEYSSLTKAEWEYLLGTSTKRNGLHKTDVTINIGGGKTVMGIVVAPDGFNASNFKAEYTKTEWAEAESAYNLVFLPAVGWSDDSDVWSVGNAGCYWLSDYNLETTNVSYLNFGSNFAKVFEDSHNNGYSVRLVKKGVPAQGK